MKENPIRYKPVRAPIVSWEARYPGGVRAINANLYDAYLLKSLDGGMAANVYAEDTAIVPCGEGKKKRCLFPYRRQERHAYVPAFRATTLSSGRPLSASTDSLRVIRATDIVDRPEISDPAVTLGLTVVPPFFCDF